MKTPSRNTNDKHQDSRLTEFFKRRIIQIGTFVLIALSLAGIFAFNMKSGVVQDGPLVTVYKSSTCGCCNKWVTHLENNGFKVETNNSRDMSNIKIKNGLPAKLQSCHTAIINGYIVEGHVPADDIKSLLKQKPDAAGLAVPGMPMGSPGMEGHRRDPYTVLLMNKDKSVSEFKKY